ncbi:hypothetical protein ACFYO1_34075 [Nocardia sp. NPDC006044]|uniref:hypothetical protein n=1 Tax=Nocardia sp. NPDC006044 TaxID=3364306 RepID=UPI0036CE5CE6
MEEQALQMVQALRNRGILTPEQMAAYVLAQDIWSGKPRLPFGPLIVVTAAGHRPDWAVDDPIRAAGVLFANQSGPADLTHVEWRVIRANTDQPRSLFRSSSRQPELVAHGTLLGWVTPEWTDYETNSGVAQRVSMVSPSGASLTLDVPTIHDLRTVLDIPATSFSNHTATIFHGFNAGSSFLGNPREIGRALCRNLGVEWR